MEAKLPPILDAERTPLVAELMAIIRAEREKIRRLEDEKEKLEGEKEKLEGEKEKLEGEKKRLKAELDRFRRRLAQYEPDVRYEGKRAASDRERSAASYSIGAEEKLSRTKFWSHLLPN